MGLITSYNIITEIIVKFENTTSVTEVVLHLAVQITSARKGGEDRQEQLQHVSL